MRPSTQTATHAPIHLVRRFGHEVRQNGGRLSLSIISLSNGNTTEYQQADHVHHFDEAVGCRAGRILEWSPTVSPVTPRLCFSLPLPVFRSMSRGSSSTVFLALSQARRHWHEHGEQLPCNDHPAKEPSSGDYTPRPKPTSSGTKRASNAGPTNSFWADPVQIATTRP